MTKVASRSAALAFKTLCLTTLLALVAAIGLAACAQQGQQSQQGAEAAVAATVNGEALLEDDVTHAIEVMRATQDLAEDDAWKAWLEGSNLTAEDLRLQKVNELAQFAIVRQAAEDMNVALADGEVDAALDEEKMVLGDDAAWSEMLRHMGMDEQMYREYEEASLLYEKMHAAATQDIALLDQADANAQAAAEDEGAGEGASSAASASASASAASPSASAETASSASSGASASATDPIDPEEVFSTWFDERLSGAVIEVNPMPSGLSYDVR